MALVTISAAAVGLAFSTALVAGSSRVEPAEVAPDSIICQDVENGYQRTVPAGSTCLPRTEVEVSPTP